MCVFLSRHTSMYFRVFLLYDIPRGQRRNRNQYSEFWMTLKSLQCWLTPLAPIYQPANTIRPNMGSLTFRRNTLTLNRSLMYFTASFCAKRKPEMIEVGWIFIPTSSFARCQIIRLHSNKKIRRYVLTFRSSAAKRTTDVVPSPTSLSWIDLTVLR
jgi:hypothetical protein